MLRSGKAWLSDSINTRSASGKFVLNVLTSVAQWEREAIVDRTWEAMAHLKQQGVRLGCVPYGWRYASDSMPTGAGSSVPHRPKKRLTVYACDPSVHS